MQSQYHTAYVSLVGNSADLELEFALFVIRVEVSKRLQLFGLGVICNATSMTYTKFELLSVHELRCSRCASAKWRHGAKRATLGINIYGYSFRQVRIFAYCQN